MRRSYYTSGIIALSAIGIYVLWRNRFQIQRFLEAQGVSLPVDKENLSSIVRSSAAKAAGKMTAAMNEAERNAV